MKKYLFFAASALALASCSSDDFVGDNSGNLHGTTNGEIAFAGETGKITRAGSIKGASAAELLGKKFYVLGTKGTLSNDNPTETKVFDNYQVKWEANTAGTTSDNTNDWRYEGLDFTALNRTATTGGKQTIKYWDYSQPQYDFIAYSIGSNELVTDANTITAGKVYGSSIETPKGTEYKSYTLKGSSINDLQKCYYTDIVTVENTRESPNYGKPVQFTFKNITAKVRVAFYETVPGYTVSDLQFYADNTTGKADLSDDNHKNATLFTTGDDKLTKNGQMDIIYPVVGSSNKTQAAYNKAFVTVKSQETETSIALGEVNYGTNNVLATSAKEATMAGTSTQSYYTPVLPVAEATPLTIRMNYTLTSEDGSGETIKVYGAKAVIPAAYTAWQPNHAYTYIFKISDNTNGTTSTTTDKEGLFPITFDAVVNDVTENDFTHESITTVSTPSVTTYAWDATNSKVVNAYGEGAVDQYPAGSDIYFSVTTNNTDDKAETKSDLNNKGKLYTLTLGGTNADKATEAEVIDALQVRTSAGTEDLADNITGRNGLTLAAATTSFPTTIPTENGKENHVTENSVALLSPSIAGTYAYVYFVKEDTDETFVTAVKGDGTTKAKENEYYTDYACTDGNVVAENTTLAANTIYYKKYTNNKKVYGVKVVKVTAKP